MLANFARPQGLVLFLLWHDAKRTIFVHDYRVNDGRESANAHGRRFGGSGEVVSRLAGGTKNTLTMRILKGLSAA